MKESSFRPLCSAPKQIERGIRKKAIKTISEFISGSENIRLKRADGEIVFRDCRARTQSFRFNQRVAFILINVIFIFYLKRLKATRTRQKLIVVVDQQFDVIHQTRTHTHPLPLPLPHTVCVERTNEDDQCGAHTLTLTHRETSIFIFSLIV